MKLRNHVQNVLRIRIHHHQAKKHVFHVILPKSLQQELQSALNVMLVNLWHLKKFARIALLDKKVLMDKMHVLFA